MNKMRFMKAKQNIKLKITFRSLRLINEQIIYNKKNKTGISHKQIETVC